MSETLLYPPPLIKTPRPKCNADYTLKHEIQIRIPTQRDTLILELEVERPNDGICVVDGQRANIRHGLDLLGYLLDLVIGHGEAKLLDTALDGVPASQTRREVHVAGDAPILGVQDLVCAWGLEDGLGVNARLVGEGAEARHRVVEGNVLKAGQRGVYTSKRRGRLTISTASATKSSISLSLRSLYLEVT